MIRSTAASLATLALLAAGCGAGDDVEVEAPAAAPVDDDAEVDGDTPAEDLDDVDDIEEDVEEDVVVDEEEEEEEDAVEEEDGVEEEDAVEEDVVEEDAVEEDAVEEDAVEEDAVEEDAVEEDAVEEAADPRFNVRFATYNVRTSNLNNGAWGDTRIGFDDNDAARMRRVAETIAAQNLTVVALQEVRRPERTAIVEELARRGEQWAATTQKSGPDDAMVIFDRSVWRKVRETHFQIPLQPGRGDRWQIGALLEHRRSGERLWFYSVHLAAHDDGAAARLVGIRRTVASIREHAVENGQLFVLGGDFNADAAGPIGDVLRDAGFAKNTRNVADTRAGNGCATFNGRAGSAGQQTCPGGSARHIDQVWVSRAGFDVVRYQVTATALTSRASDHNPLTTILRTR